jgi:Tol biopolymer transport system component
MEARQNSGSPDAAQGARRWRTRAAWLAAAAVALAAALWAGRGRLSSGPRLPLPTVAAPLAATSVTSFPGFESFAELSPDGLRVAFSWGGPEQDNVDIYVADLAGGEPRRLTTDPAGDAGPTWSPDGRRVAFARYLRDRTCEVFEVAADGGPERPLGSCGRNITGDLAWSPDGEWLAFSDRDATDVSFGIYLLSTVTGERRQLIAPDGRHWGDTEPAFSPDGRQLSFTRSVSMATQDVYRVALEGGEPVPVTRDGRSIRGHAWTADGEALVVSSRRTGARGLWRFPLDGGAPRRVPLAVGHAWRPSLGRGAGPLVFESRVVEVGIQRYDLELGKGPAGWLQSTFEDLDPQYSPDGRRIAFTSNRSGHFEIWVAEEDGGRPVQLTALGGSYTGGPRWSPDGRWIVFDARLDGQADVYRVASGGGRPQRLTDDPANELAPSYSADGDWIYFGSDRGERWQIWRLPASGGAPRQITDDGGYLALESGDGETLYLARYGEERLFRRPVKGGETLPVEHSSGLVGFENWTVAGDALYVAVVDVEGIRVVRLEDGREPDIVRNLGDARLMPGLDVSPDGDALLLAEITRLEADLWQVDLSASHH